MRFLFAILFIIFQPQTIDSLFAKSSFLLDLINLIVGFKPAIPGIALIVKSFLFLKLIESNLFIILQYLKFFFFTFK